jgi:hypothetical protein
VAGCGPRRRSGANRIRTGKCVPSPGDNPLAGKIKPGTVSNEIFSGLDWFPAAAVGQLDIKHNLLNGYTVGSKTYKNHLDRYRLRTPVLKEAKAFLYELNLPSEPSRR